MRGIIRCAGQGHRTTTDTKVKRYKRFTAKILADLERGVRPWTKPSSAEHLGNRVMRSFGAPARATT